MQAPSAEDLDRGQHRVPAGFGAALEPGRAKGPDPDAGCGDEGTAAGHEALRVAGAVDLGAAGGRPPDHHRRSWRPARVEDLIARIGDEPHPVVALQHDAATATDARHPAMMPGAPPPATS